MKQFFKSSVLIPAAIASFALAAACSSDPPADDDDDNGGSGGTTGGSSGSGGSGAAPCTPGGDVTLIPNDTGWVDKTDACNDVGVQGAWFPYGDQYGDLAKGEAKCIGAGMHLPSECAIITEPLPPPAMGFPNLGGMMRTTGTVEKILPCVAGSEAATIPTSGCPGAGAGGGTDYASMWGAGIGFALNANKGGTEGDGAKNVWNPDAQVPPVLGIAFTITGIPLAGMRVEFPMQLTEAEAALDTPPITGPNPTSDSHTKGAPYWGAQSKGNEGWPKSPVVEGENKIFFDDLSATTGIETPNTTFYKFDRARMLQVQFHVLSGSTASSYDFTVSNIRFLRTR